MSRRGSMPVIWGAVGCAAALVLLAGHGLAQQNATFNSYQVEEGWLQLPEGRSLGLATKVAIDRDGRSLWVFDRCGAVDCVGSKWDPIVKFDRLGTPVVRFGAGMFNHPHGLHSIMTAICGRPTIMAAAARGTKCSSSARRARC